MQDAWLVAASLGLGAIGYVGRRWIEGRRRSECLKRKLQALALHQGMGKAGPSIADLDKIERDAAGQ